MDTATLIKSTSTKSQLKYSIVKYEYVFPDLNGVGDEAIFQIPLRAPAAPGETPLTAYTNCIDLSEISACCDSTSFDFIVYNCNPTQDPSVINAVLVHTDENLSFSNIFDRFVIQNDDDPIVRNRLYFKVINNCDINVGTIKMRLTYTSQSTHHIDDSGDDV